MTTPSGGYRIGQAAEAAGVSTRTLRYYEQRGLLLPSSHSPGGERRYNNDDVERLQTIRQLVEDLGTDLDTVRVMLDAEDQLAGIRGEYHKPGQSRDRQLELLDEAAAVNADLQDRVAARLEGLRKVQAHLRAKAARYEDVRSTLTTEVLSGQA
jgi:DNA-binding transcriptional MerR regulator